MAPRASVHCGGSRVVTSQLQGIESRGGGTQQEGSGHPLDPRASLNDPLVSVKPTSYLLPSCSHATSDTVKGLIHHSPEAPKENMWLLF